MATFAPISLENLEALRRSGQTDDSIAETMAQNSPSFASQLSKIRKKFAGDPAATTAYLNSRFYGKVDYTPDAPKGLVGRSLDRIYDNFQKDTGDIRTALERNAQGQDSFAESVSQVAGNLSSIVASPVSIPLQEGVATAAKAIYENVPYVKPLLQEVGQSRLVQEGIAPAIQGISQTASQLQEKSGAFRALTALGEGASDLADVYGGAQAAKAGIKGAQTVAQAIPNIPRIAGQAIGTTARVATQPIRSAASGFMQGVRGQVDDASRVGAQSVDNVATELTGVAKQAVDAGLGESTVRFAVQQSPETKKAMGAMVRAAQKGSQKLGGDTAHKEILGSYILNNMNHVLSEKDITGKALGAMKRGMADEVIDLTDDLSTLNSELARVGAITNDKGQIVRLAAESDDNIPLLQEAIAFLQPDQSGRVVRRFKDIDMWRSKMFKEMNSAKAKLQPSASGQSTFGFAESVVNKLRKSSITKAAKNNPRLLAYNNAYEELSTQASKFLKKIGYKGKMDIDSITAKELKAGEIALRSLGNASADTREAFQELIATARKYGFNSGVDEDALIRWADEVENLFPVTPTRSLSGQVARGTRDALGNFVEDVVRSGAKRGVGQVVSEKVMDGINTLRGITPENQYKLLLEILDAPADTPLIKVVDRVLDDVPASVKSSLRGIDAGDVQDAISPAQLPKALPRDGATKAESAPSSFEAVNNVDNYKFNASEIRKYLDDYKSFKKSKTYLGGDDLNVYGQGDSLGQSVRELQAKGAFKFLDRNMQAADYDGVVDAVNKALDHHRGKPIYDSIMQLKKKLQGGSLEGDTGVGEFMDGYRNAFQKSTSNDIDLIREMVEDKSFGLSWDESLDSFGTTPRMVYDELIEKQASKNAKSAATRAAKKAGANQDFASSTGGDVEGGARLAKKFPTLTPEEISALTPEEKATGILGGGDSVKKGVKVYHGTASDFGDFDLSFGGKSTGAKSGQRAMWFTDDPRVAKGYALYAAEDAPVQNIIKQSDDVMKQAQKLQASGKTAEANKLFTKADDLLAEAEKMDAYDSRLARRSSMKVKEETLSGDFYEVDAMGKTPQELSDDLDIDSWINKQLDIAKKAGKDGVVFKNLDDAAGLYDTPSTHYAIFEKSAIKPKSK